MTEAPRAIAWFRGLPARSWTSDTWLCPGCRAAGRPRCELGIVDEQVTDDGLRAAVRLSAHHEGGPGVASGSWLTGIMNEVCGAVAISRGLTAVNKTLTTTFRRPVPLHTDLVVDARFVRLDRDECRTTGALSLASTGAELVTAELLSVLRDASHYERAAAWFAEQQPEGPS